MKRRGPKGPEGSADKALNLGVPLDLYKRIALSALAAGVTVREWIRQACRERLERERDDDAKGSSHG